MARELSKHLLSLLACLIYVSYAAVAADSQTGPTIGSIAPDFKARNLVTGEVLSLSSQRGKIVILTFWASWCAPCRRELPILEKAQMIVGKDKLTVFAVSYRESPDAERGLKRVASPWHIDVIEDRNGWIASRYAISTIPHLFLIDREGKVVANHLGYGDRSLEELVGDINHALKESAPAEQGTPPTPALAPTLADSTH
jgi:thiol-disulfide isomerase/thioredoxin